MSGLEPDRRQKPPFSCTLEVLACIETLNEQNPDRIPRDSLDNIVDMLANSNLLPHELEQIGERVFMLGFQTLAASLRLEETYTVSSPSYQKAATQADDFFYFVAKVDRMIASFPRPKTGNEIVTGSFEPEGLSERVEILISALKGIAGEEDGAVSSDDLIEVFEDPATTRKDLDAIRQVTLSSGRAIIQDSQGEDSTLQVALGYLELAIRAERVSQKRFGLWTQDK